MFCGIVDHLGTLEHIAPKPDGVLLRIRSQFTDFSLGESIAVDGVCLTVTASDGNTFECELSPETLNVTIAHHYRSGQLLNLERAMRLSDRMGGHWVTGHVSETITVSRKARHDEFVEFYFSDVAKPTLSYLVPKGSVAINGVSLTVNTVDETGFSLMLIPHTLERTNLSSLKVNDRVNVEWDYLAKLVEKQLETKNTSLH